jgi:purine nucleoside phosphorylase
MSYRYKTAVVAKIKKRNKPQVVNRDTEHIEQAARAIRRCWPLRPQVCLILGTGLGSLVDSIDTDLVLSYEGIPHFPCSTAPSHKGRLVCGRLAGVPVVTMDGRCHVYEGYRVDEITLPVRVARSLGATLLIVSNASGGLNPRFATGDLMVVADHVNLMGRRTGSYASAFAGHRRGRSRDVDGAGSHCRRTERDAGTGHLDDHQRRDTRCAAEGPSQRCDGGRPKRRTQIAKDRPRRCRSRSFPLIACCNG